MMNKFIELILVQYYIVLVEYDLNKDSLWERIRRALDAFRRIEDLYDELYEYQWIKSNI